MGLVCNELKNKNTENTMKKFLRINQQTISAQYKLRAPFDPIFGK